MKKLCRSRLLAAWLTALSLAGTEAAAVTAQEVLPAPHATYPSLSSGLPAPLLSEGQSPPLLTLPQPDATEKPLAIDLPTALRLAGGRPVVILAAQASVETAAAELARAKVLWLPSVYGGAGYYRHDGATQGQSGTLYINSKEQFMAGGGLAARVATADALFAPLAARQVLRAREIDVQAARNDALLVTAEAYFNVQQARGRVAGAQDAIDKGQALVEKVRVLSKGVLSRGDLHRAQAALADIEESMTIDQENWRLASADLTQVLRLEPASVIVPLEPAHLRVTLISPQACVDDLIPIGLTNRPELASQQALVQAALARIKQERLRPLIPSLVLQGTPGAVAPGGYLAAGVFASGVHGAGNPTGVRDDVSVELVWGLDNLGLGNHALVRERRAEQQQVLVELFRLQDLVAAEVVRAHAQVKFAADRMNISEKGLQQAQQAYAGNLEGFGQLTAVEDVKVLKNRAQEVVAALQLLARAYDSYFSSVNDYNRAQFRLFRALGYPAEGLACGQ
jgi:outer membrane protein TolC